MVLIANSQLSLIIISLYAFILRSQVLNTQPSCLSTSLRLLSHFRMLMVVVLLGLRGLKTMHCALSHSPLSLPLSFSIVLLCCECSLHHDTNNIWLSKRKATTTKMVLNCCFSHIMIFYAVKKYGRTRLIIAATEKKKKKLDIAATITAMDYNLKPCPCK